MSTNSSAWVIGIALAIAPLAANATGSSCTTTCTLGAVECDADGGIETCVQQGTAGNSGCSAAAELVYVVDVNNTFSSFTPGPTGAFNDIGTLNCPDNSGGTPFSMSVDRSGTAWIIYSDGELFNVNTTTLACTDTGYNNGTWMNFGMGFTTDTSGGTTDSLYIANVSPLELGILNTSTLGVGSVGSLTGSPELTGNSLAELWAFFPDSSHPRVSELNKTTAAEGTSWPMTALAGNPEDWAFAYYGGDFYVFLQRDSDSSTNVWHLDGTTGAVNELMTNTGREIVGAGESTCVPTTTCYGWTDSPCPTGQLCSAGACAATCTNTCTAGAVQCDASGNIETCGLQASGCTDWNTAPCPSGQTCSNGACVPACVSRCTAPDSQCDADGGIESCDLQANGCYDWSSSACPSNQACVNGACSPTCTNACLVPASQCSGSVIQNCAEQSNTCTAWVNGTDCGALGCVNGECCSCIAGAMQCDSSGNLQRCESNPVSQSCPNWVTIPCAGGACYEGACYQTCSPNQEFGACTAPSTCIPIPGGPSGDFCAIADTDGGYTSPDPIPSSATAGAAGTTGAAGTAGAAGSAGGASGGTNGGVGTTGGANGGSIGDSGATGAAGSTGSQHSLGAVVGASSGGSSGSHESGLSSSGSGTAGKGDGAVAISGCGCQSKGDLSLDGLLLAGLLLGASRRRRA